MKVHVHLMDGQVLNFAAAMAKGLRVGLLSQEGKVVPFYYDNVGLGEEEFSIPEFHLNGSLSAEIMNANGYRVGPQSIHALVDDAPEPGKPHPCAWICETRSGSIETFGPTVEVAVARCFVADKLGLVVEIPDVLFK